MCKSLLVVVILSFGLTLSYAQNRDSSAYYFQKGIEEKNARKYREAEKNFLKAHQQAPGNTEILMELGNAYLAQNRYAEAREKYLRVDKLKANDPIVIENLATLSFNLRKWDEAIKYAEKSQRLRPDKPVSFIIGKSYYEQENYGEAVKHLQMAAKEEPARAEISYIIARSYLDMNNYKQSAGFFEKAIALDSSKVNWIYEAGLVFYAVPDYKKSLTYIELAGAKGYKKSNDYLENLGNAYINVNEYEKGIEVLKEVMKRKPSDQELIYQVAQAYFKAKKYQEAIDTWDIALALDKTNANALYMIGLAYQKKGEKQKGQQLCDKAIEMDSSLKSLRQKQDMGMGL
jgi:tetratricopeptide (TPR) repeat protein